MPRFQLPFFSRKVKFTAGPTSSYCRQLYLVRRLCIGFSMNADATECISCAATRTKTNESQLKQRGQRNSDPRLRTTFEVFLTLSHTPTRYQKLNAVVRWSEYGDNSNKTECYCGFTVLKVNLCPDPKLSQRTALCNLAQLMLTRHLPKRSSANGVTQKARHLLEHLFDNATIFF